VWTLSEKRNEFGAKKKKKKKKKNERKRKKKEKTMKKKFGANKNYDRGI